MPATRSRFSHIPFGFVTALLLVGITEWMVARHDLNLIELVDLCWRVSSWASEHQSKECTVLCLGDSQVKQSIIPNELERRTGQRAYNLAVVGGNAASSYFLLRRSIAAGSHPSTVIVDFSPVNLEGDLKIHSRHWAELLTLGECVELSWEASDSGAFGELALMKLLPSFAARKSLREDITSAFHSANSTRRVVSIPIWQNWNRNRGAMLFAENPYNSDSMKNIAPNDWFAYVPPRTNPINARFLEKILALASEHEISVYWVLPPLDPFVQTFREREGYEDTHIQIVNSCIQRYDNITVIDVRHSEYKWDAMWDRYHLNWRGALSITAEVAEILNAKDKLPKWKVAKPYSKTQEQTPIDRVDFIALMQKNIRK